MDTVLVFSGRLTITQRRQGTAGRIGAWRRPSCLVLLLAASTALLLPSGAQEPEELPLPPPAREEGGTLLPLPKLSVKSADIHGQVYIAGERQGQEEEPAKDVVIQVRTPETGDLLREARTDEDGRYTFDRLAPGIYYFVIGSLRMNLVVEPGELAVGELPKIILVVLPRDMTRFQP